MVHILDLCHGKVFESYVRHRLTSFTMKMINHQENFVALEHLNFAQTGQLDPLFHTCTDLVNSGGVQQNTHWLMSNIFPLPFLSRNFIWLNIHSNWSVHCEFALVQKVHANISQW